MSDGILKGVSLAELADYFNEVDLEYTWLQEPQTMTHSDEVAQLRARIAELERERDAALETAERLERRANQAAGRALEYRDAWKEADTDARKLAKRAEHTLDCLYATPLATGGGFWHCTCEVGALKLKYED